MGGKTWPIVYVSRRADSGKYLGFQDETLALFDDAADAQLWKTRREAYESARDQPDPNGFEVVAFELREVNLIEELA